MDDIITQDEVIDDEIADKINAYNQAILDISDEMDKNGKIDFHDEAKDVKIPSITTKEEK